MSSVAETIENIWVAHASQIPGITTCLSYEPGTVDRKKMPLLALFFLLPESVVAATGPEEDVDYRFEVSLYVALADFETAQIEMRDLSQLVVANFRQHRSDYDLADGVDIFARSLMRRNPPTPGDEEDYLRASWELQITSGEQ